MGMFDWLTGTKRPAAGVAPKSATEVRSALLAVSRPTAPFVVRDGAPERVDLVAEWRIVDASWYEIFAKAGLKKVFKILMRLDPQKHEVRAVIVEGRQIFLHGAAAALRIARLVPLRARDRSLLVGVRRNQARIDRKPFTANQVGGNAGLNNALKHPPECIALPEPLMTGTGKYRVIWDFVFGREPAKPAIGEVYL